MSARIFISRILLLAGTFVLAGAVPAVAIPFTVTSTADEADDSLGDGICRTASLTCTLRAAVQEANASAGPDTITLPAGTYTLTIPEGIPGPGGYDPDGGDLDIIDSLTIDATADASATIVEASASLATSLFRVFDVLVPPGGAVELNGITIRHGNAGTSAPPFFCGGGGLVNRNDASGTGTLTLTNTIVKTNIAHNGGGICNNNHGTLLDPGMMILVGTTVTGNFAFNGVVNSQGGGITNTGGSSLTIRDSTVSGNQSQNGHAGGVANVFGGRIEIVNSTISGNTAFFDGGGLWNTANSIAQIRNATIANNDASLIKPGSVGGVSAIEASDVYLRHTIIAGNTGIIPDCRGLQSLGFNLIGIAGPPLPDCGLNFGATDQVGTDVSPLDAKLGPLLYNGGPTQTRALLAGSPGSPALDAGDPAGCDDTDASLLTTDQRGRSRPGPALPSCDLGAYEAQQVFGGVTASAQASTGAGLVTFTTSAGTFGSLDPVSEADLPTAGKPSVTFPFGFFSWTVSELAPGTTITVTITYPTPLASPADYWKVLGSTWTNLASVPGIVGDDDGDNVLTLTLTDGVFPDADGVVNGQISDPGGVATHSAPLPTTTNQCRNGGWQTFGVFKNQGDCVSFVATKGKNRPSRP